MTNLRWTVLFVLLAGMMALAVVTRADAAVRVSSAKFDCAEARRAVVFYRAKVAGVRAKLNLSGLPPVERRPSCARSVTRAAYWRKNARAHRRFYDYHYDWRSWLPANWYRVGSCETGYGGDPNWEHTNSQFTSAFGISWAEYNANAAYMGAPPWHVRHTPRDQYKAALGHYARFGDGWTCPGP